MFWLALAIIIVAVVACAWIWCDPLNREAPPAPDPQDYATTREYRTALSEWQRKYYPNKDWTK